MTRPRAPLALALLIALGALLACHGRGPDTPPAPPAPPALEGEGYHAGVARADITPPPHLALFGHGPEGRIATGFRLRLRCAAFVLAQGRELVALVPCDLAAPSLALHREVGEQLARRGVPVPLDRLLLMATHTHAGPAHYFEARRYSGSFSSYAPGYDPRVVEFLGERIAAAVAEAYGRLAPACLSWRRDELAGLTFNRSYAAFARNRGAGGGEAPALARAAEQERALSRGGGPATPAAAERAVDAEISVLRVDARAPGAASCGPGAARPLGAFAVFGMHPTAIPNTNELYHGDVFGFAARAAEACLVEGEARPEGAPWRCEARGPREGEPVVGIANGVEGDLSPKAAFQSVAEARRLGRLLGRKIVELVEDREGRFPALARGPLDRAYWELRLPGARLGAGAREALCPTAELGVAAGGGARDGPTRLRLLTEANAGYRLARPHGCHGVKLPLTSYGADAEHDFPRLGPVALVRVAGGAIATAPGELTTVTGQRVREAVRARLGEAPAALPVVGLTNSYLQYFATGAEYELQLYEGASTLYGPRSSDFLVNHFGCLTNYLVRGDRGGCDNPARPDAAEPLRADPAPVVARLPGDEPDEAPRGRAPIAARAAVDGEGAFVIEAHLGRRPLRALSDRRRFWVEIRRGGEVVDDDRGSNVEVREVGEGERWRVRWQPDVVDDAGGCDPRCGGRFRFVIGVGGGAQLESNEVELACQRCPKGAP
ncbi:MAG TPA: neutral/alkaline non-lysosomal ceramidase N-terminal domain-containing protein [Polyangiaceae bacterium]|nr:neutral/alkaline non-lysosomal ceramidase N-terminal domain-containing protein [Polyangiaceae bacterium]